MQDHLNIVNSFLPVVNSMNITIKAQIADTQNIFTDEFNFHHPLNNPSKQIIRLKSANICIFSFGILVGRLEYDIRGNLLYAKNFSRITLNRFEQLVVKRYKLDTYWKTPLTNV